MFSTSISPAYSCCSIRFLNVSCARHVIVSLRPWWFGTWYENTWNVYKVNGHSSYSSYLNWHSKQKRGAVVGLQQNFQTEPSFYSFLTFCDIKLLLRTASYCNKTAFPAEKHQDSVATNKPFLHRNLQSLSTTICQRENEEWRSDRVRFSIAHADMLCAICSGTSLLILKFCVTVNSLVFQVQRIKCTASVAFLSLSVFLYLNF